MNRELLEFDIDMSEVFSEEDEVLDRLNIKLKGRVQGKTLSKKEKLRRISKNARRIKDSE